MKNTFKKYSLVVLCSLLINGDVLTQTCLEQRDVVMKLFKDFIENTDTLARRKNIDNIFGVKDLIIPNFLSGTKGNFKLEDLIYFLNTKKDRQYKIVASKESNFGKTTSKDVKCKNRVMIVSIDEYDLSINDSKSVRKIDIIVDLIPIESLSNGKMKYVIQSIRMPQNEKDYNAYELSKAAITSLQSIINTKVTSDLFKYRKLVFKYFEENAQIYINSNIDSNSLQMNIDELATYLQVKKPKTITLNSAGMNFYFKESDKLFVRAYKHVDAYKDGLPYPDRFKKTPIYNSPNLSNHKEGWFFEKMLLTLNY